MGGILRKEVAAGLHPTKGNNVGPLEDKFRILGRVFNCFSVKFWFRGNAGYLSLLFGGRQSLYGILTSALMVNFTEKWYARAKWKNYGEYLDITLEEPVGRTVEVELMS